MNEPLVPYDIAKSLKEKGFDWATYWQYMDEGLWPSLGCKFETKAPTLSHAAMWLREVHGVCVEVGSYSRNEHTYSVMDYEDSTPRKNGDHPYHIEPRENLPTYDEALTEGIREALKLIET